MHSEALISCARRGDVDGMKACIRGLSQVPRGRNVRAVVAQVAGAGLPGGGWTALHYCADRNDAAGPEMIAQLLGVGVDCNVAAGLSGSTPVMLAADVGCTKSAMMLFRAGASVFSEDMRGWTPLHFAAHRGNPELVDACLLLGADAMAQTKQGSMPLHLAAAAGAIEAARVLVSQAVSRGLSTASIILSAQGSLPYGDTPLHVAARHGHTALALEFASLDCTNLMLRNAQGHDAPTAARRHGHSYTASALSRFLCLRRRWWLVRLCALLVARRAELAVLGPFDPCEPRVESIFVAAPIVLRRATQHMSRVAMLTTDEASRAGVTAANAAPRVNVQVSRPADIELPEVRWSSRRESDSDAAEALFAPSRALSCSMEAEVVLRDARAVSDSHAEVSSAGARAVGVSIVRLSEIPRSLQRIVISML
jgi:hypothetical protein